VNPTSLVSGVITLPAHVAAAATLAEHLEQGTTFADFFDQAHLNPPVARKAPAGKATAKKAPARKAPARRRAPSKKAAVMAPALGLTEAEAEDLLRTPSGIPAAGDGINPDTTETDLHQPGTEPLMDPATVKAVTSESEVLRRAADTDKG